MWFIPLKKYREREEKRIKKQQGWTGKESKKRRTEKEGRKNEKMRAKEKNKSEFIGLVYKLISLVTTMFLRNHIIDYEKNIKL